MFKRIVEYKDFEGRDVSEEFYFHISKTELLYLDAQYPGGFRGFMERIMRAQDKAGLIREMKELILVSYGQKSPDGRRFIKSDELRTEFSQTAAFDTLFMDLASNDVAAVEFAKGILPADLASEADAANVNVFSAPEVTKNEQMLAEAVEAAKKPTSNIPPPPHSV